MPNLPEENNAGKFDFVKKVVPAVSSTPVSAPFVIKKSLKLPKKLMAGLLALVVVLVCIYFGASYFSVKKTQKSPEVAAEVKPFEYPINVAEIKFPGEEIKQLFLSNLQKASTENNADLRYKFLEDDFVMLLGFYTSSASYDYRVQLDQYKRYMKVNYTEKFVANPALYDFPCVDKLCTGGSVPSEIKKITEDIGKNAVLNSNIKDSVIRNFDAASFNKNKIIQSNMYMGALSMLVSEYKRTNDEQIKGISLELTDFITRNYDQVKIPDALKL